MVSQPGEAGVAHVLADQVTWAVDAGWSVDVACDPDSSLAQLVTARGGRVAPWRAVREPGSSVAHEAAQLTAIIAQSDPALVHLHSSKAGLVGRLVIRGRRPTLFQPHSWAFDAGLGRARRLATDWERWARRWTHMTICVSRAEQQRGLRAGVIGRSVLLPNVVDVERFQPSGDRAQSRRALRAQLGLVDGPLAVCVGRLARQKGQDLLLAAWPAVASALPDARLALLGDGPERERLVASAPPDVLFMGHVTDPLKWMQAADVVVLPSRWEGQALSLLEAQACGAPLIVSDIEANAETLAAGAGAVISVLDSQAFSAALIERLAPETKEAFVKQGLAGRDHVLAHHVKATAGHALMSIYAGALSRSSKSPPARAS